MAAKKNIIPRDISWLSFNARVLQEANDPTVPLKERIRFLGIHSNNQDEFFRVRVATLKRMQEVMKKGVKAAMHLEKSPDFILGEIHRIVLQQQNEFARIWENIVKELAKEKVFLITEKQISKEQQAFIEKYYDEQVSPNLIPLMIEDIPQMPYLRDKSIYLGVVMRKKKSAYHQKYALIEIPAKAVGRFVLLPSRQGEKHIMLLEDVIRYNLPHIFSYFGYDHFSAHIFKVTKDAELDIDNDIATDTAQRIERSLKKRREGRPVRFVYDKEMDAGLLEYLMRRLNLSRKDNLIPGGRIHNFRHFMDFPDVLPARNARKPSFIHPALDDGKRITDVVQQQDVMLSFPYHDFTSLIHLLREAAMDPDVSTIKLTAYRLASNSRIINALINAVRNGKKVTVVIELRARFDEEANLEWKKILEQEGVKVLIGFPNLKVHAKLCLIRKKVKNKTIQYGFVSTGNLNEKTARIYGDFCLMTSNRLIMADINRVFNHLEKPTPTMAQLRLCKTLLVCPVNMRKTLHAHINREIAHAKAGKPARIIIKVNSLSDELLITHLYKAAEAGVEIKMIIRGIFCARFDAVKLTKQQQPYCISIVDEYLEHARILVFHNQGKPDVYISSADFMVRNLDHRIEAAAPVTDPEIKQELLDILEIQLSDNVKARRLDKELKNEYVKPVGKKKTKSQVEVYRYLAQKKISSPAHPRFDDRHYVILD
ncbi:MAG: polyphosphate kinase 1 [Chitinophagaceae bacterium]|nr:polyphosphate kinase 1 [Chitinophagaceae bacterium]